MSKKLNDTQLIVLSGASQREDRCVAVLAGGNRRQTVRIIDPLIEAGLLKEIRAKAQATIWRREEESGRSYSLRITAAGMKAIAVEEEATAGEIGGERQPEAVTPIGTKDDPDSQVASVEEAGAPVGAGHSAPRQATKIANVVALIERPGGATVEELIATTGWLPHTTRAALTGLRKRGFDVTLDRTDKRRGSVYRMASAVIPAGNLASENKSAATDVPTALPDSAKPKRVRRAA